MVINCLNRSIFTEVIVKINQRVRFLDHTVHVSQMFKRGQLIIISSHTRKLLVAVNAT